MTKEHLGLALALNVPVFVVITKIDMCPPNVLEETLKVTSYYNLYNPTMLPLICLLDLDTVSYTVIPTYTVIPKSNL